MTERTELLESLAETIADYREGHVPRRTPSVIDEWLRQFPPSAQVPILRELEHVFRKTYFSRAKVEARLHDLATEHIQPGIDPAAFWPSARLLDIQQGGQSQRDMTAMFRGLFRNAHGVELESPPDTSTFVYLDDFSGTGMRILQDLQVWIRDSAPAICELHIVLLVRHKAGSAYAERELGKAIREARKSIRIRWWPSVQIENRPSHVPDSEVLWPRQIPNVGMARDYVSSLRYHPVLRSGQPSRPSRIFSSEEGRHTLEQQFLARGVDIRLANPNLNRYQRPLGNSVLNTVGLGTMVVLFRNCPNSTPLALWASERALFPRSTN